MKLLDQLGITRPIITGTPDGTPRGLAGFIADLHTLGFADGVTLLPLRAADNADRIINHVLPMLGLDVARLSA